MLSSRRLLVREASPSGNEVSLPVKVKAGDKQPNLLSFELIKIKPKNVKRNWAVQLLGPYCQLKTQQLNRVWLECKFFSLFRNWWKTGEQKMSKAYVRQKGADW